MEKSDLSKDNRELISKYVDICNRALNVNKNRFPFKQILRAASLSESGLRVKVVMADDGRSVKGLLLKDDEICCCDLSDFDREWVVQEEYLRNVLCSPEEYISNPAKLNWDWLYSGDRPH